MIRRALGVLVTLLPVLAGCGGVPAPTGFDEPIIVSPAQLHEGSLPGGPNGTGTETVTLLAVSNLWYAGRSGISLANSLVTPGAYAVGIELVGVSHGYWVFPVGPVESGQPGMPRSFAATLSVSSELPPGNYTLRAVALDASGNSGAWTDSVVCVTDPVNPDSCKGEVPDAVISLDWDLDADLDLIVIAPDGTRIDARHASYPAYDSNTTMPDGTAVFALDSNANCVIDGRNSERVTWSKPALVPGQYQIYVDLNSACQQPNVHYRVSVYRGQNGTPNTLVRTFDIGGNLQPINASGGVGIGTYLGAVELP